MVQHLVVNLDRLEKTESAQASLQGQGAEVGSKVTIMAGVSSSSRVVENKEKDKVIVEVDEEAPLIGMAECRICQEEDSVRNLESPCACSGSLKYAHRKCVQHWCDEKGDITCEICHQSYQPGYVAPPRPEPVETVIDMGGGWQIAGTPINLHDPRLLAFAEAERQLLEAEYNDFHASHASGAAFFRSVLLILMALLLMRHAFSMNDDGDGDDEDASTVFSLFLLRAIGFLLPCYITVWIITVLQQRRQRQEASALARAPFTVLVQSRQNRGVQFAISAPAPIPVPATAATAISSPRHEEV